MRTHPTPHPYTKILYKSARGECTRAQVLFFPPPITALLMVAVLFTFATSAPAQTATIKKVNAKRLVHLGTNQTAHLTTGGKVSADPFSGVAFTEGEDWRAEVTYSNGILDGPVSVVKNNRLLYQFQYRKGVKILPTK